jgi:hypothetical protein
LHAQRNSRCDTQRPFKYEVWWQAYADFPSVVRTVWRVKMPGQDTWSNVKSKLKSSQSACRQWRKTHSNPTEALILQKTSVLGVLQEEANEESMGLVKSLQVEINDLIEIEDLKWRQRAKQNWLKHGDKNSKFFHACVNHRRRNNMLLKIQNLEGGMCSNQMVVEEAFMSYFKGVFWSNGIDNVELCLSEMPRRIYEEMNCRLLQPCTSKEAGIALQQMGPFKAPGPDGFSAAFYQQNWPSIGNEVCSAISDFIQLGHMDGEINSTNIVLIPKKTNPVSVKDFRPISLCNVICKLTYFFKKKINRCLYYF